MNTILYLRTSCVLSIFLLSNAYAFAQMERTLPDIPANELLMVPETIQIHKRKLTMTASIWIDYMPTIPASGGRKYLSIFIKAEGTAPFPKTVFADAVWIVNKDEVWKAILPKENMDLGSASSNTLGKHMKGGPEWGIDVNVDVIVSLIDPKGHTSYFLRVPNQSIHATY